MGFSATEELRAALNQARAEAVALNHEYIGPEHILLALVTPPSALVRRLLATRTVDQRQVRDAVEAIVQRGRATSGPDLPYTSTAKQVLEFALAEARDLSADAMNTDHLFLGLMRQERGIPAQVLDDLGFTLDAVREQYVAITADGHGEHRIEGQPGAPDMLRASVRSREMPPEAAAAALQMMARSPRVAAVFERHGVDIPALIRDLATLPPTT